MLKSNLVFLGQMQLSDKIFTFLCIAVLKNIKDSFIMYNFFYIFALSKTGL